jgi:hypothetical protein
MVDSRFAPSCHPSSAYGHDYGPCNSGYYIWRGAPNESDLSPETRRTMFPHFSFFLGDQLQALGYPISGVDDELRAGHRRCKAWFTPSLKRDIVSSVAWA